jgi:hypothetical protein
LLFTDKTGQARKLEAGGQEAEAKKPKDADSSEAHLTSGSTLDRGPGYSVAMGVGFIPQSGMSGWAPGQMPRYLPEGIGFPLPKKADVVMQVHYHRNGRTERDRTQIGLYLAKKPVEKPMQGGILAGGQGSGPLRMFFSIQPGDEQFKLDGDLWATKDFTMLSVMPHMHKLGKEINVTMTPPDGKEQTLVSIKDWDYNWQETYFLKEPLQIKAGTRFHVKAVYDNSEKNPRNPFTPPRRITYGEQTTNEMCFVFFGGISNNVRSLPLSPFQPSAPKTAAK